MRHTYSRTANPLCLCRKLKSLIWISNISFSNFLSVNLVLPLGSPSTVTFQGVLNRSWTFSAFPKCNVLILFWYVPSFHFISKYRRTPRHCLSFILPRLLLKSSEEVDINTFIICPYSCAPGKVFLVSITISSSCVGINTQSLSLKHIASTLTKENVETLLFIFLNTC